MFIYLGFYAAEKGNLNCDSFCKSFGFICTKEIKTGNSKKIFEEAGLSCSGDESQNLYTKPYHPVYYPDNNLCVGYTNISLPIVCNINETVADKDAVRLCYCSNPGTVTTQKMEVSIKDFFSKYDQICSFQRIWSHLLKKSLMENFIFCAVG